MFYQNFLREVCIINMPVDAPSKTIIIKPTKGWSSLYLAELWRYRELLYFLAWRDIKVRYKQTLLGIAWAIVNPVMQMVVWTFIFGKIAKLPSLGMPYALIALSGTLAWNYFSEIVNGSGNSVINNSNLITKIYFPRLIIPLSVVLRALLDFGIALLVFIVMIIYFRVVPTFLMLLLPFFTLLVTVIAVGIGVWATAISVKYRDVAKILPYFIQIGFFLTPVAYLTVIIPAKFQWIYYLNPVAGAIDGFRWVLLGTPISWSKFVIQFFIAIVIFISGLFYFKRLEQSFADVI